MRGKQFRPVAQTLSDDDACDEAGDASVEVHDRATGEVQDAGITEEAPTPDPMGDGCVYQEHPSTIEH